MSDLTLRRFYFDRQTDVSGTSGTGAVVEGIEFSDGQVVLRWRTSPHSSIAIYKSMEAAVYIHGHDGSTNLHYIDPDPRLAALLAAVHEMLDFSDPWGDAIEVDKRLHDALAAFEEPLSRYGIPIDGVERDEP